MTQQQWTGGADDWPKEVRQEAAIIAAACDSHRRACDRQAHRLIGPGAEGRLADCAGSQSLYVTLKNDTWLLQVSEIDHDLFLIQATASDVRLECEVSSIGTPDRLLHLGGHLTWANVFRDGWSGKVNFGRSSVDVRCEDARGVLAPYSAVVARQLVRTGDEVETGTPLVTLRARTTEEVIKSPRRATVSRSPGHVGQRVAPGDVLVELQPPSHLSAHSPLAHLGQLEHRPPPSALQQIRAFIRGFDSDSDSPAGSLATVAAERTHLANREITTVLHTYAAVLVATGPVTFAQSPRPVSGGEYLARLRKSPLGDLDTYPDEYLQSLNTWTAATAPPADPDRAVRGLYRATIAQTRLEESSRTVGRLLELCLTGPPPRIDDPASLRTIEHWSPDSEVVAHAALLLERLG